MENPERDAEADCLMVELWLFGFVLQVWIGGERRHP